MRGLWVERPFFQEKGNVARPVQGHQRLFGEMHLNLTSSYELMDNVYKGGALLFKIDGRTNGSEVKSRKIRDFLNRYTKIFWWLFS